MYKEIENEFLALKTDVENGVSFGRYFDDYDYQDEYSMNQICEFREKFIEKAEEYLREHVPGKYMISSGFCVFILTHEEANKRKIYDWEECVIK